MADAIKFDSGKPRVELAMGPGFLEISKALTYGATKYSDFNYAQGEGLNWLRLAGAAGRHLAAWLMGEDTDPESGISHLGHCGASVLMLMNLIAWGKGTDGRLGVVSSPQPQPEQLEIWSKTYADPLPPRVEKTSWDVRLSEVFWCRLCEEKQLVDSPRTGFMTECANCKACMCLTCMPPEKS